MERQASAPSRKSTVSEQKQVFTFFVQDMMFGLSVDNVLMLDQNVDKIQAVPVDAQGFCGVIKFQGVVVPVLDFAHRVGVDSGLDIKKALQATLKQKEREHQDWAKSIEHALQYGEPFHLDLDASDCASTLWFRQFDSRDETLNELINAMIEPHHQLHQAGEMAVRQSQGQDAGQMAMRFKQEAGQYLHKMHTLSHRAQEQIESDMRQVLLFVADDGKTPRYALLLDEINDITRYDVSEFQSSSSGALAQIRKIREILAGIYSRGNEQDCLFLDIDKLVDQDALEAGQA